MITKRTPATPLQRFLVEVGCPRTTEKYNSTLASMSRTEFRKAAHFEYAESLVYFGLLERKVTPIMQGAHIRGSRTEFRIT